MELKEGQVPPTYVAVPPLRGTLLRVLSMLETMQ